MKHSFIFLLTGRLSHILLHRKKEEKWARQFLRNLEKQFEGKFDPFTFDKIAKSYAIYIIMFCDAFTQNWHRNTTRIEKIRTLHYFICSSLFDDFCDRKSIGMERLNAISFEQDSFVPNTFDEQLFLYAHRFLLDEVKEKEKYISISKYLYQSQIDSFAQSEPRKLDHSELERITLAKGGYSVLISGYYLDIPMDEKLEKCYYEIGSIIQVINDLFDIYKDIQEHSQTLPNRMINVYDFEKFYIHIVNQLITNIEALDLDVERKKRFYFAMMNICSFGFVAIHHLKKIQKADPILPDLKKLPRKSLIIDMEKWSNIWFCIRFCYEKQKCIDKN